MMVDFTMIISLLWMCDKKSQPQHVCRVQLDSASPSNGTSTNLLIELRITGGYKWLCHNIIIRTNSFIWIVVD